MTSPTVQPTGATSPLSVFADIASNARSTRASLAIDAERALLDGIPHEMLSFSAGEEILADGEALGGTYLMLSGWAFRYKALMDGRRQIIGFVLPGDLCSSWIGGMGAMSHGVRSLTISRVARIDRDVIFQRLVENSALIERFRQVAAQEHTILGAWLLNIGQRKAPERIAHLFCELATRMRKIGLSPVDDGYEVPLTQQDLADALGLTSVHVNRVLQKLRERHFIDFRRGMISIQDVPALCAYVEFKDGYLSH